MKKMYLSALSMDCGRRRVADAGANAPQDNRPRRRRQTEMAIAPIDERVRETHRGQSGPEKQIEVKHKKRENQIRGNLISSSVRLPTNKHSDTSYRINSRTLYGSGVWNSWPLICMQINNNNMGARELRESCERGTKTRITRATSITNIFTNTSTRLPIDRSADSTICSKQVNAYRRTRALTHARSIGRGWTRHQLNERPFQRRTRDEEQTHRIISPEQ